MQERLDSLENRDLDLRQQRDPLNYETIFISLDSANKGFDSTRVKIEEMFRSLAPIRSIIYVRDGLMVEVPSTFLKNKNWFRLEKIIGEVPGVKDVSIIPF
jgi:hypothetical protein